MAIVKFVIDENCQLFIDMELVGNVFAGKMLKISLDIGSYLVEGKKANGKSIGKYKLTISPSDTQVLENLSEKFNEIDTAIYNLRNDSSLRFFHQRAVFCYNGNYGYINGQYKIAIEPIYSYAENFTKGLALVKKLFPDGEKATVIDINGNIYLDRWYDYIGGDEKNILLKSEKLFYVLSKANYSIVNQYLDAKYDGKGVLIPVHKHIGVDDMYGYIDRTGTEVIPLIYDFAGNFSTNDIAWVKRFGEYNVVDLNGNLYRYGIHSYRSKRETEFLSKEESLYRGFSGCVKRGNYWGLNSDEEPCWDRIIYNSDSYLVYRKNGICNIVIKRKEYFEFGFLNIIDAKKISIEADYIDLAFSWAYRPTSECLYLQFIVVMKNWKYGIVDLHKNIILPIEYDFIEPTDAYIPIESQGASESAEIAIVWKNEKCSLFNMSKGEFVVPFEFEDIIVNENFDHCLNPIMDSSFLMKKNGKYGLIANDCKTVILPFEYDSIDYNVVNDYLERCERVILTKNGKMGIMQKYHYLNDSTDRWEDVIVQLDEEYDECVFLEDQKSKAKLFDVAVRMANKWAIINCNNGNVDVDNLLFKYDSLDVIKSVRHPPIIKIGSPSGCVFRLKRKNTE